MTFRLKKFVTRFRHQYFIRVSLLALMVIVAVTQMRFARRTFYKDNSPDLVSRSENRLAAARRLLPQRGFIGYLPSEESQAVAAERYFRAQYALAPLVLQWNNFELSIVLADFGDHDEPAELFRMWDLEIQADFGDGLKLLYRHER